MLLYLLLLYSKSFFSYFIFQKWNHGSVISHTTLEIQMLLMLLVNVTGLKDHRTSTLRCLRFGAFKVWPYDGIGGVFVSPSTLAYALWHSEESRVPPNSNEISTPVCPFTIQSSTTLLFFLINLDNTYHVPIFSPTSNDIWYLSTPIFS